MYIDLLDTCKKLEFIYKANSMIHIISMHYSTYPNRTSSRFGTDGKFTSMDVFPFEIAAPTAAELCFAI